MDKEHLNEHNRGLYQQEVDKLIQQLNKLIPGDQEKLFIPDLKFYRRIGDYAGQPYSVKGEKLTEEEYQKHREEVFPNEADFAVLNDIFKDNNWIEDKNAPAQAQ